MAKKRIIIIDDAPFILNILKYNLEKEGYEVFIGANGEEGLKILETIYPDLVLVDIMMPIMDGYTFVKRIRQNNNLKDLKVVFLTSLRSKDDVAKAVALGVKDYIMKPFTPQVVLERVEKILSN